MAQYQGNLAVYIQLTPIILMIILAILLLSITVQSQHTYQESYASNMSPLSAVTSKTHLCFRWYLFLLSAFCIYKIVIKYQLFLKRYFLNNIQNISKHIQYTINKKKDNDNQISEPEVHEARVTGVAINHHDNDKSCTQQTSPQESTLKETCINITSNPPVSKKKKINNNKKAHHPGHQEQQQQEQNMSEGRTKSTEWIVVTEAKKNKKHSSPSTVVPIVKENRHSSNPTISPSNRRKSKCGKTQKSNSTKTASSPMTINNDKVHSTVVSPGLPWTNIVKSRENEPDASITDDVPFLSDNESVTGSIESPCMSHKELCHQTAEEVTGEGKYYSPFFSTGFDFGVLPSTCRQPQPQPKLTQQLMSYSSIDNRLDEYLNSQQAYWSTSNKQYTPSSNATQQHRKSILNLLNQSEQVETTITPASFKYFDDMMMSTSLYKTDDTTTVNKYSLLMNNNKRDWDSISHFIR